MGRVTSGHPAITVFQLPPNGTLDAFRVVKADPPSEDDFRSHYELGKPPRRHEREWAVMYMGLSMFREPDQAAWVARRWSAIGDHVAHLRLEPDRGINLASTGKIPGHYSVWGSPDQLLACVVDTVSVEEV